MKGLRIFTIVALAVLTAVGWVTFAVDTGTGVVSYQSSISEADQYVEEGLYQRAILKYKEAIARHDTKENWAKLFHAYDLRYQEDAGILSDFIADLQSALALHPRNIDFIQKLYELHMVSNDIESAYDCLSTAIENGVEDENIRKEAQKLKYSYELDYHTYTAFRSLSASVYAVSNGEKWGYIDTAGESLADYKYFYAGSLNDEKVRVCDTELGSRLLDGDGMVLGIFPFTVTDSGVFADGLVPVLNGEKYSYYNSFAKEQFGGYDAAGTFQDGLAAVQKDGAWFLIDTSGAEKSDKFADIVTDNNGRYLTGEVMVAAKEAGKYQLFDEKGKPVSDFTADQMDICTADGIIAFEKDGKWGFVDASGKVVIEPCYEQAKSFSCGLAAVCQSGRWGFINSSNELVIEYRFAGADYFNSAGTCMVRGDAPDADDEILWQLLVLNLGL